MKNIFIFTALAMILLFGCIGNSKSVVNVSGGSMHDNGSMMIKNDSMINESIHDNESMMQNISTMNESSNMHTNSYSGILIAGSTTPYVRYNEADFNKARSEGKTIYIYFYATWCEICAAERPLVFDSFNSMNYSDVVGFEVHYKDDQSNDQDNAAIEKFQIPYQHSTLILNGKGDVVFKSFTPLSETDILSQVAKARQ